MTRLVLASPTDYVRCERRVIDSEWPDDYTAYDRVSHLVSDEMMAWERDERVRAFTLPGEVES